MFNTVKVNQWNITLVYLIEGRKKLEIKRVVENDRIGEFINVEFSQYATDCVVTLNFEEFCFVAEDNGKIAGVL